MSRRIGVLTSGGDAQGMNAALRAVVRTALHHGVDVFAICEGYRGMVEGGERIRPLAWDSVGGILHRAGTVIGTARCEAFQTREGRLTAALNLVGRDIDRLVVVGGDGSLTGAHVFWQEWPGLVSELVQGGRVDAGIAARHPHLTIVGLVGSIDNDMFGTDMTIGADTALHRITEAIDAIAATAASHQRSFVVKVMGRNCGYLALMGALSTGADWVLIPESPPYVDDWERAMCERLRAGRQAGRRDSIVVLAEGARDRHGKPIGSSYVQKVIEESLKEEVRVTVLGHVQRGGSPSAFDRNLGTLMGHAAVEAILAASPGAEPQLIGMRGNRVTRSPLMHCVEQTHEVARAIGAGDFEKAMSLRGPSFGEAFSTLRTFLRAMPRAPATGQKSLRLAVLNAGAPSPGMNTATRAAVRLGVDRGHVMLGIVNGFQGLAEGKVRELDWMSVNGWASMGGSELGTNRKVPKGAELYGIARAIEEQQIQGLLVIGGWAGYESAYKLLRERANFPAFDVPIVCLPASIANNLPGSELAIGADTALNCIVEAVDKIKRSAVAARRVFVVEVMGRNCGYLALMSGLATGAERVYLNEEGVTLADLQADVESLGRGFEQGKRLGVLIRNENANLVYTTGFMVALFEEEGGDAYDVRQAILGHLQQGGDPSPFDRIQASRLATRSIEFLADRASRGSSESAFIGLWAGKVQMSPLEDFPRHVDEAKQRPKEQWWMDLGPIARLLAQPGPGGDHHR